MRLRYSLCRKLIAGMVLLIIYMPIELKAQSVTEEQYNTAQTALNRISTEIKQKNLGMKQASDAGNAESYAKLKSEYEALTKQLATHKKVIQDYMAGNRQFTEVQRLYNEGQRNAKLGKWQDALLAYDQAISKGESMQSSGIAPTISSSYYMKGYVLKRQKKTKEAITHYEKAVSIDPNNDDAFFAMANAHRELGQNSDAIADYLKAIEIDPLNSKAYYNLGVVYDQQKKYSQAEEMFQKSSQADPEYTQAKVSLGQVLVKQGKHSTAIPALLQAVQEDKKEWKAYWLLAQSYNAVGQPQNAIMSAESSAKIRRNGGAYIEMGDAYQKIGSEAKAKQSYENALRDRNWRETAQYKIKMMEEKDKYIE